MASRPRTPRSSVPKDFVPQETVTVPKDISADKISTLTELPPAIQPQTGFITYDIGQPHNERMKPLYKAVRIHGKEKVLSSLALHFSQLIIGDRMKVIQGNILLHDLIHLYKENIEYERDLNDFENTTRVWTEEAKVSGPKIEEVQDGVSQDDEGRSPQVEA